MSADRWMRLERYARWRRLTRASEWDSDVASLIVAHCDPGTLLAFGYAFSGSGDTAAMPEYLRRPWLCAFYASQLTHYLQWFAQHFIYDAQRWHTLQITADWSAFSGAPPCPLAEVRWNALVPRVTLHREVISDFAESQVGKAIGGCRIAVHTAVCFDGGVFTNPDPYRTTSFTLPSGRHLVPAMMAAGPCSSAR